MDAETAAKFFLDMNKAGIVARIEPLDCAAPKPDYRVVAADEVSGEALAALGALVVGGRP